MTSPFFCPCGFLKLYNKVNVIRKNMGFNLANNDIGLTPGLKRFRNPGTKLFLGLDCLFSLLFSCF